MPLNIIETQLKEAYKFLQDEDVTEIMLNDDGYIHLDRMTEGLVKTGVKVEYENALNLIKILASNMKRVVNNENPTISATFPSGERFEGVIPPITDRPIFSIRKPSIYNFTLKEYMDIGGITREQYVVLRASVKARKNILVVGGTGSGKTTLCNAIISEMKHYNERIITIEDTKELKVESENKVSLITSDRCDIRQLLYSSMRLRPDRICIGEVRGGEALNLLKAWNSGHNGGICTIHANDSLGGLQQLEQYILEVSNNPQRELIGRSIDIVVNIVREEQKRYVREIVKLERYSKDSNRYILKKIEVRKGEGER